MKKHIKKQTIKRIKPLTNDQMQILIFLASLAGGHSSNRKKLKEYLIKYGFDGTQTEIFEFEKEVPQSATASQIDREELLMQKLKEKHNR